MLLRDYYNSLKVPAIKSNLKNCIAKKNSNVVVLLSKKIIKEKKMAALINANQNIKRMLYVLC